MASFGFCWIEKKSSPRTMSLLWSSKARLQSTSSRLTIVPTILERNALLITRRYTAKDIAHQKNIWSRYECEGALRQYLNLSIEEALLSENDFIKALSLFDARTGKRRLAALETNSYQHLLVRQFYTVRCEAENLKPVSS